MIKIIISGTYDGFEPRYASDNNLEDDVTQSIQDRRNILRIDSERLYKEGYSFQRLNEGILFHKLILLFDGFGRDGYMMASLFLPKDEKIDGASIKTALDGIVRTLKDHTGSGLANISIDMSFVKQKADQLNAKVENLKWRKHLVRGDASLTAMVDVSDNLIADYFQYPNPMHSGFDSYGEVFLTKSLLNPGRTKETDEKGYRVLGSEYVDISNPDYDIVPDRELLPEEKVDFTNKKISKKQLETSAGDISVGTLSRDGYRTGKIVIRSNTKSVDGMTVTASLPELQPKSALVSLKILDDATGKEIHGSITVEWSRFEDGGYTKINGTTKEFNTVECDRTWYYKVNCEGYLIKNGSILVVDRMKEEKEVRLSVPQLWEVWIQYPGGSSKPIFSEVAEDQQCAKIENAKLIAKERGYTVSDEDIKFDKVNSRINVVCKKNVDNDVPTIVHSIPDTGNMEKEDGEKSSQPDKQKYFLFLDDKSRKYSLFSNYRRKIKLSDTLSDNIQSLEEYIKSNGNNNENASPIGLLKGILGWLKKNNSKKANEILDKLKDKFKQFSSSDGGRTIISKVEDAIDCLEYIGIPEVVEYPAGVTYNPDQHRLECEGNPPVSVKLGRDKYEYEILKPRWTRDNFSSGKCTVKRKMLMSTMLLRIGLPVVGLLAVVAIVLFCIPKENKEDMYQLYVNKIQKLLDECYELSSFDDRNTRFVGNDKFNELSDLNGEILKFEEENKEFVTDSVFLKLHEEFEKQKQRKSADSIAYSKVCDKSLSDVNRLTYLSDSVLSKEHYEELSRENNIPDLPVDESAEDEEGYQECELYGKCVSSDGTLEYCKTFIDKYKEDGRFKTDLENVKEKMNELGQKLYEKAKDTRLTKTKRKEACEDYLKYCDDYFTSLSYKKEIKEIYTLITGENNVNPNNPAPTPATEAGSKPTEKKKITTFPGLLEALGEVDDVVKGTFYDKFEIDSNSNGNLKLRWEKDVNDLIINAEKLENNEYKEIYKTVKAMNKGSADKLTELGKRVKQKAKEKN